MIIKLSNLKIINANIVNDSLIKLIHVFLTQTEVNLITVRDNSFNNK